jgi:hypothetical protein
MNHYRKSQWRACYPHICFKGDEAEAPPPTFHQLKTEKFQRRSIRRAQKEARRFRGFLSKRFRQQEKSLLARAGLRLRGGRIVPMGREEFLRSLPELERGLAERQFQALDAINQGNLQALLTPGQKQAMQSQFEQMKEQAARRGIEISGDDPMTAVSESTAGQGILRQFRERTQNVLGAEAQRRIGEFGGTLGAIRGLSGFTQQVGQFGLGQATGLVGLQGLPAGLGGTFTQQPGLINKDGGFSAGGAAGGALSGAASGAAIGSVVPGIGTTIGAVGGGILGALGGGFGG